MSAAQIDWARGHDWFYAVTKDGLGVIVEEHATQHGVPLPVTYSTFYDIKALRRWAGY